LLDRVACIMILMSEEYVRVTLATKAHSLRENCLRETRDMFKTQNLAVLGVFRIGKTDFGSDI
jgi:hypothetical protein